jgi:hypothetical protein
MIINPFPLCYIGIEQTSVPKSETLELGILLPLPLKHWDYRYAPHAQLVTDVLNGADNLVVAFTSTKQATEVSSMNFCRNCSVYKLTTQSQN